MRHESVFGPVLLEIGGNMPETPHKSIDIVQSHSLRVFCAPWYYEMVSRDRLRNQNC